MNKTFQTNFYVPAPIRTDWRTFLIRNLKVAFPENPETHTNDQFLSIYRIYDNLHVSKKGFSTPRGIKLFINEIGTHHRVWHDEIPLPSQAVYVLLNREYKTHDNLTQALRAGDLLAPIILTLTSLPGEIILKQLAALHFTVDLDKALQVLLEQPIKDAIDPDSDGGRLKQLANNVAFFDILGDVLQNEANEWAKESPKKLSFLGSFSLLSKEDDHADEIPEIWRHLGRGLSLVQAWPSLNKKDGSGISKILENCEKKERESTLGDVLEKLSSSLPRQEAKSDDGEETKYTFDPSELGNWVEGTAEVIRFSISRNTEQILKQKFSVPGPSEIYWEVCKFISQSPAHNELAVHYQPKAKPQEILRFLTQLSQEGKFDATFPKIITVLTSLGKNWPWKTLADGLNKRLQATNLAAPEIGGCIETLFTLKNVGLDIGALLNQLTTQGFLFHHLHHCQSDKTFREMALCLIPIMIYAPQGKPEQSPEHAPQGIAFYKKLFESPESYENAAKEFAMLMAKYNLAENVLCEAQKNPSLSGFISLVLASISLDKDLIQTLDTSLIIDNHVYLENIFTPNTKGLNDLIAELAGKTDFIEKLKAADFHTSLATYFLLAFDHISEEERADLATNLIPKIQTIRQDIWKGELSGRKALFELTAMLAEKGYSLDPSTNLSAAIYELAQENPDNPENFPISSSQFKPLLGALTEYDRSTLLRNVRDILASPSTKSLVSLLNLYSDILIESGILQEGEKADEIVRNLFMGVLNRKNADEMKRLMELVQKETSFFSNCLPSTLESFKGRISNDLLSLSLSEECRSLLERIGETVDIDIQKIKEEIQAKKEKEESAEEEQTEKPAEETGEENN